MTTNELEAQPRTKELVQVLLDLSLVSHVRGVSYDTSGGGKSASETSGSIPPGGIDRRGDKQDNFRQKSADVFVRRLNGLLRRADRISAESAEATRDEILSDAETALRSWRRTPEIPGRDPDHGTRGWKIRIANDERPSRVVAGKYGISHVSVLRYRRDYGGLVE